MHCCEGMRGDGVNMLICSLCVGSFRSRQPVCYLSTTLWALALATLRAQVATLPMWPRWPRTCWCCSNTSLQRGPSSRYASWTGTSVCFTVAWSYRTLRRTRSPKEWFYCIHGHLNGCKLLVPLLSGLTHLRCSSFGLESLKKYLLASLHSEDTEKGAKH